MTATELLMEVMETFGNAEPINILVVHTNQDEDICVRSNCGAVTAIGMAEFARQAMVKKAMPANLR